MATLIASYPVYSAGADTSALSTPSFTPANGEVIVVKLATWDTANPMGTVSGGGQTYSTRVTGAPGGFNAWCRIVTATVSGSPGAMTVTAAGTTTNSRHSMVVERWTGQLAASPAVNATVNGSGAPSANITTAAASSAVSWVSADVASQDPATRAYRLSATEDGLYDGHVGSNSVHYFAYVADVGAAGTYAMGLTAPGSQTWVLAGIEIQSASGSSVSADAALTATGTVAPTAAIDRPASAALNATASLSSVAVVSRAASVALAVTGSVSAGAAVDRAASAALTATAAIGVSAGDRFTRRPDSGSTARPASGTTLRP